MHTRRLFRRKAASEYLHETHGWNCAQSTLAKLAVIGGGALFRRIGRVPLYATDDLDKWVMSNLSPPMRSTSGAAEPKAKITDCSKQPDRGGEQQENGTGKNRTISKVGA